MKGIEEKNRTYKFDQVFGMSTKQSDVYKGLGITQMVNKVVEVCSVPFLRKLIGLPCDRICLWVNRVRENFHNGRIRL